MAPNERTWLQKPATTKSIINALSIDFHHDVRLFIKIKLDFAPASTTITCLLPSRAKSGYSQLPRRQRYWWRWSAKMKTAKRPEMKLIFQEHSVVELHWFRNGICHGNQALVTTSVHKDLTIRTCSSIRLSATAHRSLEKSEKTLRYQLVYGYASAHWYILTKPNGTSAKTGNYCKHQITSYAGPQNSPNDADHPTMIRCDRIGSLLYALVRKDWKLRLNVCNDVHISTSRKACVHKDGRLQ